MNEDDHARAQRLMLEGQVEDVSEEERAWLEQHLRSCSACEQMAGETQRAVRSLRAISVSLPPSLASRTQLRIYLRAQELQTRQHGEWALWLGCGVSWVAGIATAPYVWRGFAWLGQRAGVPDLIWEMGFTLWWALPALVAAAIFLAAKLAREHETGWRL